MDNSVNDLREGGQEIRRVDFGVEEDLRREEALVSHIDTVRLCGCIRIIPTGDCGSGRTDPSRHCILPIILDEVLVRFRIILPVLLHDILADVAVLFLHLSCNLQLILWRNGRHLPPFSHQIQHELADIPAGDGNVLDRTANHVSLGTRDNVRDTIARVNNCSGERTIRDLVGGPGGGEGEHCLDGDVETFDIERFEKDLRSLFSVLGCVERRFGLREVAEVSRSLVRSNFLHAPVRSSDPLAPPSDT